MLVPSFPHIAGSATDLVKNHLLSDAVIPYASIVAGILVCKVVYNFTQLFGALYFKSYAGLNRVQRIEWSNRGISTVHALFIAAMSLYFVYWSDLYADYQTNGFVTFRSSVLSTFTLGVSVGYFIADLAMIMWLYPSLGGMEFLDTVGLKRSHAYLINGIVIFFAWLVARILLFVYMFYHVYLHYDQVMQMHAFGFLLVFVVPSVLAAMNLMWFGKILKGLKKTLAKKQ